MSPTLVPLTLSSRAHVPRTPHLPRSSRLLAVRKRKSKVLGCSHKREFQVRWLGYDATYDSWEPESNLPSAMVDAFDRMKSVPAGPACPGPALPATASSSSAIVPNEVPNEARSPLPPASWMCPAVGETIEVEVQPNESEPAYWTVAYVIGAQTAPHTPPTP
jgi:hypothetical protein